MILRPNILTIAGFDPSGGAGLLADSKTFEQHKVQGLSICTAITLQTENKFYSIKWNDLSEVLTSVDVMLHNYPVKVVKIGIVPSFEFLMEVISYIKKYFPDIKIIVDPILKSSTDFVFQKNISEEEWVSVLKNIFLITPNFHEAVSISNTENAMEGAKKMAQHCKVFLKGGHNENALGIDYLFANETCVELQPTLKNLFPKHGSGCVLSAAIAANLALDFDLKTSCINAKKYVEHFLNSTESLIGYHNV